MPYIPQNTVADVAFTAHGDCMLPLIADGDTVLVNTSQVVDDGKIAAVKYNGQLMLKRLYHIGENIYLIPDNRRHPPIIISQADNQVLEVVGLAVAVQKAL